MNWSAEVEALCSLMQRHDLSRLRVKDQSLEVEIERRESAASERNIQVQTSEITPVHNYVLSPMVGTLYLRPAPGKAPFVQRGDVISADTIVAIVEAMKVMNEVRACKEGRVARVLMEDGQLVEYGTPIFELESPYSCE